VFNGDTAYMTQLKQQKSKMWYYLGARTFILINCQLHDEIENSNKRILHYNGFKITDIIATVLI